MATANKIILSAMAVLFGLSALALLRPAHADPFICDLESQFLPGTWQPVDMPFGKYAFVDGQSGEVVG